MSYAESTKVPIDRSQRCVEKLLSRYGHLVKFSKSVGGCWEWIGSKNKGYGEAGISKNKRARAHRVFYKTLRGNLNPKLDLDHLCRNRSCVNPNHLEMVTRRENVRRGNHQSQIARRNGTCIRGHKMDTKNLYISPQGSRQCVICRSMRERRRKKRGSP